MTTEQGRGRTRAAALSIMILAATVTSIAVDRASATPDDYVRGECISNAGIGAHPFNDVPAGSFYAEAVAWLHANDITKGVSATEYGPNQPVTRAQFATMLHRMACLPPPEGSAGFSDLRPGAFYLDAVDWMVGESITTGRTPTLFAPDELMTRGEFAAFLFRFVGEPSSAPVASVFTDVDRSRFFARPVDWLVYRSVTQGTSATTFSPERTISRAEVATFLYRLNTIGDVALALRTVSTAFSSPTAVATHQGTGDLYVAEQGGLVKRVAAGLARVPNFGSITTVLDIDGLVLSSTDPGGGFEQGLLGVAVAPDGSSIFVSYTNLAGDSVIAEYELNPDGSVDATTEHIVIAVDQPSAYTNHNGGHITFGADGHLYIGLGDGGGGGDPEENGQDTTTLLGAILRIDPFTPNLPAQYSSPADNPFVGEVGADEIWLYGARNPWKFTFDSDTGYLWVADVGQNAREEITRVAPGEARRNMGWDLREGTAFFEGPEPADHLPPIHEYAHPAGGPASITGGYVYRGDSIPALYGTYLYADFYESRLRGWRDEAGVESADLGVATPANPQTFAEDLNGEIYVFGRSGQVALITRALA